MFVFALNLIIAQEAAEGGNALGFILPLVILGGLFYVLLILPQRRRQKKMEQQRADIEIGDEVRTIGGIIGTVVDEADDIFTIDIGGQRMRVVKRAVAGKTEDNDS
ncbi:MAG: preprotein translocase subunit YajC [Acidimicrobiia bacterium]